jgi:hypothetical protein
VAAVAAEQVMLVRQRLPEEAGGLAQGPYQFKFALVDETGSVTFWSHDGTSVGGSEPVSSIQLFVTDGMFSVTLGAANVSNMAPIPQELLERGGLYLRTWYAAGYSGRFSRLPDSRISGQGFAVSAEKAFDAESLQGKTPEDFEPAGSIKRHEEQYIHVGVGETQPRPRFYSQVFSMTPGSRVVMYVLAPRDGASMRLTLHAEPSDRVLGIDALELNKAVLQDQPVNTSRTVVEQIGGGWLAGIRESYEFCNSCFKRRLAPTTNVLLDGEIYTDWKSGHVVPLDTQALGHVENFVPLGLVRFDRSLKVLSEQVGVDDALGSTVVWYYTSRSESYAPAAVTIELDGSDITPALYDAASSAGVLAPLSGSLEARFLQGVAWSAAEPPSSEDLARRPAAATWFEQALVSRAPELTAADSLLLEGEVRLPAGSAAFGLVTEIAGFVDLRIGEAWQRLLVATDPATGARVDAAIPSEGWYGIRVGLAGSDGQTGWTLELPPSVDPAEDLRTLPVLGGSGTQAWQLGPLDLGAITPLTAGEHRLAFREGAGNGGDLQVEVDLF